MSPGVTLMAMLVLATPRDVKVQLHQSEVVDGLKCTFQGLVIEDIAGSPNNAYPSGSGVNATLKLEKDGEHTVVTLTQLSAGYESHGQVEWKGMVISLLGTGDEYKKTAFVKLRFETPRDARIAAAKASALKVLGPIDWSDYPHVRVLRNAFGTQVAFRARVTMGDEPEPVITVTAARNSSAPKVEPLKLPIITPVARRIAALFTDGDWVRVVQKGDVYEATVSHPKNGDFTGGTEGYRIDPKTLEKKMLWHEAPQKKSTDSFNSDEWEEVP